MAEIYTNEGRLENYWCPICHNFTFHKPKTGKCVDCEVIVDFDPR